MLLDLSSRSKRSLPGIYYLGVEPDKHGVLLEHPPVRGASDLVVAASVGKIKFLEHFENRVEQRLPLVQHFEGGLDDEDLRPPDGFDAAGNDLVFEPLHIYLYHDRRFQVQPCSYVVETFDADGFAFGDNGIAEVPAVKIAHLEKRGGWRVDVAVNQSLAWFVAKRTAESLEVQVSLHILIQFFETVPQWLERVDLRLGEDLSHRDCVVAHIGADVKHCTDTEFSEPRVVRSGLPNNIVAHRSERQLDNVLDDSHDMFSYTQVSTCCGVPREREPEIATPR